MDDETKKELLALHARVDAQRSVFMVLMSVIGDMEPKARAEIMRGLAGFEWALRRTNERDAVLIELRAIREILEAMETPADREEGG